jgi:hypothetical protein
MPEGEPRGELAEYRARNASPTMELATKPEVLEDPYKDAAALITDEQYDLADRYVAAANEMVIRDERDDEDAGKLELDIRSLDDKLDKLFTPLKKFANTRHKALTTAETAIRKKKLNVAMRLIQQKRGERVRRIKAAEAAENARVQRELQKREEDARLAHAVDLDESGQPEAAQEVLERPAPLSQPVILQTAAPKLSGTARRATWKHQTIKPELLPRKYLMPNEPLIRDTVKGIGKSAGDPPAVVKAIAQEMNGAIEVYEDVTVREQRR